MEVSRAGTLGRYLQRLDALPDEAQPLWERARERTQGSQLCQIVLKRRCGTVIELGFPAEDVAVRALPAVTTAANGAHVEREERTIRVTSDDGARMVMGVLRPLDGDGLEPATLTVREPSLDDVFLTLTGHHAEGSEPAPVAAQGTLIFPDFALQHRRDATRRWWLEIAGFWTADYIARKLDRLRAAGLERLILCLDASRDCGRDALPEHARIVWFRRRVDPADVLAVIEADPA